MYDHFEDEKNHFLIMEYCSGGSLEDILKHRQHPFSEKEALEIIFQIGMGIDYLHQNNITHRDLKCDNILFHDNHYRIIDFGFSTDKSMNMTFLGTPLYMAPEIISRGHSGPSFYTNKVDIWALGIMLYYMLTKDFYFIADRKLALYREIQHYRFRIKSKYKKIWSDELQDLLIKCFKKKPKERLNIRQFLQHPVFISENKKYNGYQDLISSDIQKNGIFL